MAVKREEKIRKMKIFKSWDLEETKWLLIKETTL